MVHHSVSKTNCSHCARFSVFSDVLYHVRMVTKWKFINCGNLFTKKKKIRVTENATGGAVRWVVTAVTTAVTAAGRAPVNFQTNIKEAVKKNTNNSYRN